MIVKLSNSSKCHVVRMSGISNSVRPFKLLSYPRVIRSIIRQRSQRDDTMIRRQSKMSPSLRDNDTRIKEKKKKLQRSDL